MEFKYLKIANILYVEDDNSVREGYERTLQRCAKELFVSSNGQDGLEFFKENKNKIDIVVTDIKMPKLNGIDMVKEIQKISESVAIIFTSAHSDSEYLFEALDIQADGYLLKPVPVKKLMFIIDRISKNIHMEIVNKKQENIIHQMEKMTAIEEMIGNIAHQWRQPLSVISTTASGLKLSYEMNMEVSKEKAIDNLDFIVKETKELSNIIDDFRSFFKGSEVRKTDFSIKGMCDKIDCLKFDDLKEDITVIHNLDDNISLSGNENLLIQAFINIINNALFALEKIEDNQKLLFISVQKDSGKTIIKIKDNAGGVSSEVINRVFEPYFTTKHQSVGTGLGLFITYKIIIMQFDGNIEVENVSYTYEGIEYKGAEFSITI